MWIAPWYAGSGEVLLFKRKDSVRRIMRMRFGAEGFDLEGTWRLGWRWTGSINYDARLHFYQPECPQSASDLDGLFQCWRGGALRWFYAMLTKTRAPAKMVRVIMTETILEPVNNQKTKVAASYKILFCDNRTTFKHQSSKGENKKKEKRRRLATNVFFPTSTVTNLICYPRCVRRGFIRKSFYPFFKIF